MPHLLIAGAATGCWTNLGDEAILAGMVDALRGTMDVARFTVVASSPPETYTRYGCESVRFDDLPGLADAVARSDAVLLGGGSIFFDYWGCDASAVLTPRHQGLSLWVGLALLAAARDIPVMTYDVGVGPLRTDDGVLMTRAVFDAAAVNTVRDTASRELVLRWGLDAQGVIVTGDPAIAVALPDSATLPPSGRGGVTGAPTSTASDAPILGVALRQWHTDDADAWSASLAVAIDHHVDATGGRAVFIPCHRAVRWPLTDDTAAAQDVIDRMVHSDRTTLVSVDHPWQQRAAMLGRCDAVLAMRYHAALFAMRQGVPTVALSYDPKVAALLSDWGLADRCLDLDRAAADPRSVDGMLAELRKPTAGGDRAVLREGSSRMLRAERRAASSAADLVAAPRVSPSRTTETMRTLLGRMAERADERPIAVTRALDTLARRVGGPPVRRKTVAILTNRLLDRTTGEVCIGGAERYARSLARLLADLDLAPVFYQGGGSFGTGDFYGFPVHAIPFGEAVSEFQVGVATEFYHRTLDADHVLYLMPNYASGPMREDAVVVCHGVWWDHDLWTHLELRSADWLEQLQRVFTRPRRVISVDTNTGNVVRSLFPAADERIRHIPSAVDTTVFAPTAGRTKTPPLVLFPRRAEAIRGSHLVGPILDLVPDPCRFAWVGGGSASQVASLRSHARRDPRLSVREAAFDEMPAQYAQADVCVIPTVASEGQSLSCLEAMASGTAVVVTRVGGLPELVTDEVDGLVCDPTPESIAAAIRRLVRDPALRTRLGAAARATALRHTELRWRADWSKELRELGWVDRVAEARAVPYDVIIFGVINWDQRYQRPQQLAAHWGKRGRRVFYVRVRDHLPADGEPFRARTVAPGVFDVQLALPGGVKLHHAVYPGGLVDAAITALRALRGWWQIDHAVSMVELGTWLEIAAAAREAFGWPVLYDCMDDWSTFPGFAERPRVLSAERDLVRTADVMTVSAPSLQRRWAAERQDAVLVRNASDFDAFHETATSATAPDIPEPIANLRGPIAGFCGAVVEWFDVELVRHVAMARPDVQFVFVGGIARVSVDALDALDNVHFLGHQPYGDMPRYLRRFDVLLVPFVADRTTASMDLVKIYEYFATGKPVVCTPVAEMVQYARYMYLADGPAEFLTSLDAALSEDDAIARAQRIGMARLNSWDDRLDVIEQALLPVVGEASQSSRNAASTAMAHGERARPGARTRETPGGGSGVADEKPGARERELSGSGKNAVALSKELAQAKRDLAASRAELNKLNSSRAMHVVRKYWDARNALRRRASQGTKIYQLLRRG